MGGHRVPPASRADPTGPHLRPPLLPLSLPPRSAARDSTAGSGAAPGAFLGALAAFTTSISPQLRNTTQPSVGRVLEPPLQGGRGPGGGPRGLSPSPESSWVPGAWAGLVPVPSPAHGQPRGHIPAEIKPHSSFPGCQGWHSRRQLRHHRVKWQRQQLVPTEGLRGGWRAASGLGLWKR